MKTHKNKKAFTLLELMIAAVSLAVIVIGVGAALFHAHRSWTTTYNKVHGNMTTDAFVAKGAFDSVVRKSSLEAKQPQLGNGGKSIELYYYNTIASTNIDGYALFNLEGNDLVVTYGQLIANKKIEQRKDTLVRNVKDVKFTVDGANVRMVLTIEDQTRAMNVTASAVRHTS